MDNQQRGFGRYSITQFMTIMWGNNATRWN
jgi:hypothetical protein